jgi:Zn-dependent protease with chaperone function
MCTHRYSAYHHSHPTLTERLRALEVKGALQGKRVL